MAFPFTSLLISPVFTQLKNSPPHAEVVTAGKHHPHFPPILAGPLRWQVTQIARADIPLVGEEHGRPWAPGFGRIVETEATLEAGVRVVFARQLLPQQIATWESICCSLTPLSLLLLEAIGRLGATRIR